MSRSVIDCVDVLARFKKMAAARRRMIPVPQRRIAAQRVIAGSPEESIAAEYRVTVQTVRSWVGSLERAERSAAQGGYLTDWQRKWLVVPAPSLRVLNGGAA